MVLIVIKLIISLKAVIIWNVSFVIVYKRGQSALKNLELEKKLEFYNFGWKIIKIILILMFMEVKVFKIFYMRSNVFMVFSQKNIIC